jgi:hypothetical protein
MRQDLQGLAIALMVIVATVNPVRLIEGLSKLAYDETQSIVRKTDEWEKESYKNSSPEVKDTLEIMRSHNFRALRNQVDYALGKGDKEKAIEIYETIIDEAPERSYVGKGLKDNCRKNIESLEL